MEKAIKEFPLQFSFVPKVENRDKLGRFTRVIVCGMGGSHLSAGILKTVDSSVDLFIHRDYGLPDLPAKYFKDALLIASSYSGNTEEVLDFASLAYEKNYNVAVMASGGKLISFAKAHSLPHVFIPSTGIQPRSALGFSLLALVKLIGSESLLKEISLLHSVLDPEKWRKTGKSISRAMSGKIPIIYSSRRNGQIAYNWKIKFNETGKVPAFFNVVPELNHNEMAGLESLPANRKLLKNLHFIFVPDDSDHPRVQKRMVVLQEILKEQSCTVTSVFLEGQTRLERIFNSLLLADWSALYTARANKVEPDKVDFIENFKDKLKS